MPWAWRGATRTQVSDERSPPVAGLRAAHDEPREARAHTERNNHNFVPRLYIIDARWAPQPPLWGRRLKMVHLGLEVGRESTERGSQSQ